MALFRKSRKKSKGAARATDEAGLLRGASRIARELTEKKLLSKRYNKQQARKAIDNRSVTQTIIAAVAARAATRSIPGAVVIGGGLLAKTLYDRSRGRKAKIEGRKALHQRMAHDVGLRQPDHAHAGRAVEQPRRVQQARPPVLRQGTRGSGSVEGLGARWGSQDGERLNVVPEGGSPVTGTRSGAVRGGVSRGA